MSLDIFTLTINVNTPKINFDILPAEAIEDGKALQKLFTDFEELTEKKLRSDKNIKSKYIRKVKVIKKSPPYKSERPTARSL